MTRHAVALVQWTFFIESYEEFAADHDLVMDCEIMSENANFYEIFALKILIFEVFGGNLKLF